MQFHFILNGLRTAWRIIRWVVVFLRDVLRCSAGAFWAGITQALDSGSEKYVKEYLAGGGTREMAPTVKSVWTGVLAFVVALGWIIMSQLTLWLVNFLVALAL